MNKRDLVCSVLFFAIGFTTSAFAEKRVALVIGNSTYQNVARLDNPSKDASLMADTLKGLGFNLVGNGAQVNLDKATLDIAVQNFGKQIQGADVAVFYYAGHGVQVRGSNYLVPVNANPTREADVDFQMVDIALVLNQMQGSGTRLNLVILDACRNNPFGGGGLRATGGGLAQISAPEGTLISYATQPGSVALDGDDGHSPYTKALSTTIQRSGLDIFQTFNQVGLAVKRSTGGSQQPWVSSSPIDGTFYFTAPTGAASAPPAASASTPAPPQQEARLSETPKPTEKDAITDCDRLAANPTDPKHTVGIPGVKYYQIDIVSALTACNAALSKFPDDPKFNYQAGRIATVQKDYPRARQLYDKSAASNYTASYVAIGNAYLFGYGVPKDLVEARKWYEKADALSDPAGTWGIGAIYAQNSPKDYAEAARWYQKAADRGLAIAMTSLGSIYSNGGFGVTKDVDASRKWYEKSAATGEPSGITGLGNVYEKGIGVPKDIGEARKWYLRAVALGDPSAMNNLGNLLIKGNGVPKDIVEAKKLYEKSAGGGNSGGMYNLGTLYRDGNGVNQDYAQARSWFEKSAAAGNNGGLVALGQMAVNGQGGNKDYNQARQYFEKAAAAGEYSGVSNLGLLSLKGQGVTKDYNQARQYFEKAAAGGNPSGMANLGYLYQNGYGVSQDYAQARFWYEKAAVVSNAYAMRQLGGLYEKGLGVSKDTSQARNWYQMALSAGDSSAQASLDQLGSRKNK